MNRRSQRGVALVVTLVMLAIVTVMAVVFLGVSRREKASVGVSASQTTAKYMADAALARAQAEIVSRIFSTTNPFNYDLIVSTNFQNPRGFVSQADGSLPNPVNVNYTNQNGTVAKDREFFQNLANLQYDPRPPVYVPSSTGAASEFRFYLDLNRNGIFEPNGIQPLVSDRGLFYDKNGNEVSSLGPNVLRDFFVGDPEWIGVLEHADRPHSESNRFVGRYSFIALPAGKSLDLNFIHNNAKNLDARLETSGTDGYYRNHGIGSWEINFAAFLRELNTNQWLANSYIFDTRTSQPNKGEAFDDASSILGYRYDFNYKDPLYQVRNMFPGAASAFAFQNNGLDDNSDGPPLLSGFKFPGLDPNTGKDILTKTWPGARGPNTFLDFQDIYRLDSSGSATAVAMTKRLTNASWNPSVRNSSTPSPGSYNRYTYYRLLAQMGVDSEPADTTEVWEPYVEGQPFKFGKIRVPKLHLNYRNLNFDPTRQYVRDYQTNFIPWSPTIADITNQVPSGTTPVGIARVNPIDFFMAAGDRLLRSNVETNSTQLSDGKVVRHFAVGRVPATINGQVGSIPTPVRDAFSITNIQIFYGGNLTNLPQSWIYTNFEYTATAHRALQLAANIYDASNTRFIGTNDFPSVFRPVFRRSSTNIIISGYVEEVNDVFLNNPWLSPEDFWNTRGLGVHTNVNVYGVPVVIGAKKGYPNFNEYLITTQVGVTRKMELRRTAIPSRFQTNQLYVLSILNQPQFEAWNSYTQDYRRPFEVKFNASYTTFLQHKVSKTAPYTTLTNRTQTFQFAVATNLWRGNSNVSSFDSRSFMTNGQSRFLFQPVADAGYSSFNHTIGSTNRFEQSYEVPNLNLIISNKLQYFMVDTATRRVLDFVNLDRMLLETNISQGMIAGLSERSIRGDDTSGGVANLSMADLFDPRLVTAGQPLTVGVWNQIKISMGDPSVSQGLWATYLGTPERDDAIAKFKKFVNDKSAGTADALVPFTPTFAFTNQVAWQVNDPLVHYALEDLRLSRKPSPGSLNESYQPWGGNPNNPNALTATHVLLKDPLVRRSDDWSFPTNKLPNIGWLGRVHRGTPWQTVYLKSMIEQDAIFGNDTVWYDPMAWFNWSGSVGTHPTNDWKILDLFTVAPNASAARGLLSVNQTNLAAWSAVLGSVAVVTNTTTTAALTSSRGTSNPSFTNVFVEPGTLPLRQIVQGVTYTRAHFTNQFRSSPGFQTLGDILSVPELTLRSPYLNFDRSRFSTNNVPIFQQEDKQRTYGITEEEYERIPQQILSLLKTDEPRFVVYSYGQSLRPAERSIATAFGIYNICTNYMVSGESVSKAVVRIEDQPRVGNQPVKSRVVVESFNLLPAE